MEITDTTERPLYRERGNAQAAGRRLTSKRSKPEQQGDAPRAILLLHLPAQSNKEEKVGEQMAEALMNEHGAQPPVDGNKTLISFRIVLFSGISIWSNGWLTPSAPLPFSFFTVTGHTLECAGNEEGRTCSPVCSYRVHIGRPTG